MILTHKNYTIYDFRKSIIDNDDMVYAMENGQKGNGIPYKFGTRLRELRERVGFTQEELSQAVKDMVDGKKKGTQSHISNLESLKGGKLPSVPVLRALAIILETNTDYLLGLTTDDKPHGDLDDQAVVTIEDPEERAMIQEAMEALARAPKADKEYIVGLIRRLAPKKPRIIGDE